MTGSGGTGALARGADIGWQVLADPAGNEFCAFFPTATENRPASG